MPQPAYNKKKISVCTEKYSVISIAVAQKGKDYYFNLLTIVAAKVSGFGYENKVEPWYLMSLLKKKPRFPD